MNMIQYGYRGVGGINSTPLIAFNVIVDEDVSLISYIIKCIRNYDVFDLDKLHQYDMTQVVSNIYLRTYDNPLYFIMKDEKDKEFLDKCYQELLESQEFYDEFIVSTDFYQLMEYFLSSGEVKPTILCKTEREREIVKNDPLLSNVKVFMLSDASLKSLNQFNQFYVYRIDDIAPLLLPGINLKTYYISSMGLNLTENKQELKDNEYITKIADRRSRINIFDMYKSEVIGKAIY